MKRLGAVLIALASCRGSEAPPAAIPQVSAFRHDVHLAEGLECQACHEADAARGYLLKRPGSNGHAPCDGCHQHKKLFYQKPSAFCAVCHESVDPMRFGNSPLHPYPRVENTAQLVASFNHEQHLATKRPSGEQLDCESCHPVSSPDSAYARFPGHAECAECHAKSAEPPMSACRGCHQDDGPGRRRKLYVENDVRFTHGRHVVAPTGERVECRFCHEEVGQSERAEDLDLPQMRVCASCHETGLTPPEKRMKNCGLCHVNDVDSEPLPGDHTRRDEPAARRWSFASSSKPSVRERAVRRPKRGCSDPGAHPGAVTAARPSFQLLELPSLLNVVATSTPSAVKPFPKTTGVFTAPKPPKRIDSRVPQDHTPLFRRSHARAAESSGALCNYCHLGVSGSTRDPCQECHAVSRPRSHTLRFGTTGHGRLAATRPKDCAVCHEVDYCTECHSIAPQSHFPLGSFRLRHARTARLNARSCLTCHTFEATCSRCHSIDL